MYNENDYKIYKKIRRSWGEINPVTKILKSKRNYNRNRAKQEFKEFIEEELDDKT